MSALSCVSASVVFDAKQASLSLLVSDLLVLLNRPTDQLKTNKQTNSVALSPQANYND
jgi:hypothetical protein